MKALYKTGIVAGVAGALTLGGISIKDKASVDDYVTADLSPAGQTLVLKEKPESALERIAGLRLGQSEALAQEKQYKTVDEILEGTPFRKVTVDEYKQEIKKHNKVVGFLYNNNMANRADGWLAKLFKEHANKFPDITYLAIENDQSIPARKYNRLGFKKSPTYIFYMNGKSVWRHEGGPKDSDEFLRDLPVMKKNLKELSEM